VVVARPTDVRAPRGRQLGAAAVLGAVTAILGLIAIGLAVDLARLHAAQRELQKVANVAALDASRIAGGCYGVSAMGGSALQAARDEAQDAVIRNGGDPAWLAGDGRVQLGQQRVDDSGLRFFDPVFDDDGVPIGATTAHDSVHVVLFRPAPRRLIPALGSGPAGQMSASAAAMSRPVAQFGVGSGLLGVDLGESLFDDLLTDVLGGSPGISVLDYRNLFAAGVTLGDLSAAIEAGDLGQLLTEVLPGPTLVEAVADLVALATTDLGQDLTDLLGLDTALLAAAGDLTVNVGELTSQSLRQVASGAPIAIDCPELLDGLGLSCSGGSVQILDPGATAISAVPEPGVDDPEAGARSGQVLVGLPDLSLDVLGTGLTRLDLAVELSAAEGRAQLVDIRCPRAGAADPVVILRPDTRLGSGNVSVTGEVRLSLSSLGIPNPLNLLPQVRVGINLSAPIELGSATPGPDLMFVLDDGHNRLTGEPAQRDPAGSAPALADALDQALDNLSVSVDTSLTILNLQALGLVGATVNGLLNTLVADVVAARLNPVLQAVIPGLEPAIAALLQDLGVQLAYADYRVFDVTDGQPVLYER